MVLIGTCIACQYGRHEEHQRVIHAVPPSVMGGAVCGCKGECQGKPTKRVERQVEMIARAFRRGVQAAHEEDGT